MTPTTFPALVCPACRRRSGDRIDVHTVEPAGPDVLICQSCARRYPVVDGIPIVIPDLAGVDLVGALEGELAPEVQVLLAASGPDDASYPAQLAHLSIYLDAHWGDRAEPRVDGATTAIAAKLAQLPRVDTAIELGCSTGRIVAELARTADHVIGLDRHVASLRRARRVLDGDTLVYNRRVSGRRYTPATVRAGDLAVPASRRTLVCGDALDPPLVPMSAARVVALNVLDAVAHPRQLLAVMYDLCAPGGEIILATPYAWSSQVVEPGEELDQAGVLAWFADHQLDIADQADLPWTLRRDARTTLGYCIHYLRARKL